MSYADDEPMRIRLRAPFDRKLIGKLPKTARRPSLDYIGHAAVTDRLNKEAPDWTYHIEPVIIVGTLIREKHPDRSDTFAFQPDPNGLPHVVAVFGEFIVGGIARQEVGEVENFTEYGDELKKAISNFIRRGAMRFGVGLDLWSKEDLSVETVEPGSNAAPPGGDTRNAPGSATSPEEYGEGSKGATSQPGDSGTSESSSSSPDAVQDETHVHGQWEEATNPKFMLCTRLAPNGRTCGYAELKTKIEAA